MSESEANDVPAWENPQLRLTREVFEETINALLTELGPVIGQAGADRIVSAYHSALLLWGGGDHG